jgi:putative heme-binding domain-containing protein
VDHESKPLQSFDVASVKREAKLANPADASQPLEARARSYLHANCGHCHCEGGGGAVNLRLRLPVSVAQMNAVSVRPTRGDFGLPEACIIKPGDPFSSTLYFRMAKFGRDRMPHIGSDRPDEAVLGLVEKWIAGMNGTGGKPDPLPNRAMPEELLSNPRSALLAARKLARGQMKSGERDQLLAAAAKLSPGPVRDLFEGYLPSETKGSPKLGSNPRPKLILSLKGNAERGEKLFWSSAVNCGTCHKIGEQGKPVGPDLSTIGKLRSREDLLTSILEPSRRIEPKYASYVVHTVDGRSFTGVLVKRDAKEMVLRDAQAQEIVVSSKNVEEALPSRASLMPEGQLAGLTVQEAADLLEFLAMRK